MGAGDMLFVVVKCIYVLRRLNPKAEILNPKEGRNPRPEGLKNLTAKYANQSQGQTFNRRQRRKTEGELKFIKARSAVRGWVLGTCCYA